MLNTSDSMVLRVEERSLLRLRGATPRRRRRTPGFSDLALIFGAHGFPKTQGGSWWVGRKSNVTWIWTVFKLSWSKVQIGSIEWNCRTSAFDLSVLYVPASDRSLVKIRSQRKQQHRSFQQICGIYPSYIAMSYDHLRFLHQVGIWKLSGKIVLQILSNNKW